MPDIYDDRRLTFVFLEDRDGMPEIEVIRNVFSKMAAITKEPGYKRKFTTNESEMIRGLDQFINKRNIKTDEKYQYLYNQWKC